MPLYTRTLIQPITPYNKAVLNARQIVPHIFVVRGGCSFCWHWWNCWPLLFKLSFHNWNEMYL